ncbi:MAG: hypothetical protein JO326_14740 [Acetobacteraceae bacterium]|nr:hypothetical protein [Acetobacteraceae bacterium]
MARELVPHYGEDCPAAVVMRASRADEEIRRATLATLAEPAPTGGMTLILVGRALEPGGFRDSALYDPGYVRRFRGAEAKGA